MFGGGGSNGGLPYPVAPHGMLLGEGRPHRRGGRPHPRRWSLSPRTSGTHFRPPPPPNPLSPHPPTPTHTRIAVTARYAAVQQALSLASIVLGLLLFLLSWSSLAHLTATTGEVAGLLLSLSGGVGYLGVRQRSGALVNAQIVAAMACVILGFNLIGEVSRDVQVDCALAELHQRSVALDKSVAALRQDEAMHAVVNRLTELEGEMSLVQQVWVHLLLCDNCAAPLSALPWPHPPTAAITRSWRALAGCCRRARRSSLSCGRARRP